MQEKISQNELHWFYVEPYVLTVRFKDKNKEKPHSLLAGIFYLPEDNLLLMLHLKLILNETENSYTLTDLNLEERRHFSVVFKMPPATPTPCISVSTS